MPQIGCVAREHGKEFDPGWNVFGGDVRVDVGVQSGDLRRGLVASQRVAEQKQGGMPSSLGL
jgi:hypothetical protein